MHAWLFQMRQIYDHGFLHSHTFKVENQLCDGEVKETDKKLKTTEDTLHSLLEEKLSIDSQRDGRYTDEIRQTVMALGSLEVGSCKISSVTDIVCRQRLGVVVTPLPSSTTIKEIFLECNLVAKMRMSDDLIKKSNLPLHSDVIFLDTNWLQLHTLTPLA